MTLHPTKTQASLYLFFALFILISCAKDSDILADAVYEDLISDIEEVDSTTGTTTEENTSSEEDATTEEDTSVEENAEEENTEEETPVEMESRTTTFYPLHDAHLQNNIGYNQSIVRLEENNRVSYLMFNLLPIQEIKGVITGAAFRFTVNTDGGHGDITVNKGSSAEWSETSLTSSNAPRIIKILGTVDKDYTIGITEEVVLNDAEIAPEKISLVLTHKNGDDLAFASKEHPQDLAPSLAITYDAPIDAPEITETGEIEENNKAPNAVIEANPVEGVAPLNVSFDANKSTDDNEIVSYLWKFKDGSTSSKKNPEHTFEKSGTYVVELTVTDNEGLTNSTTIEIIVEAQNNEAPKAVIGANPTTGIAPLTVQFNGDGSTDDKGIAKYNWTFKDGSSSTKKNPEHIFLESGTYEVELRVTDNEGLSSSKKVNIVVESSENKAPAAIAKASPTSGEAPLEVQFDATGSTDDKEIVKYYWDFRNGKTANNKKPSHLFANPGTYDVNLTVTDAEGLKSTDKVTITVTEPSNQAPKAVAKANPTSGKVPLTVQFNGDGSTDDKKIVGYSWDFRDGTTSTSKNPSHTFIRVGTFGVNLKVTDEEGLEHTHKVTITVNEDTSNNPSGDNVYYVTPSGKAGNNGRSQSSAWSLEHAFKNAKAGDVVYVKAGNYGSKQVVAVKSGTAGNPVKYIGYTNTPGDVNSAQGSTFRYGDQLNASKMPLLSGNAPSGEGQGTAIVVNGKYVHIENFQITKYAKGLAWGGDDGYAKNIIVSQIGDYNPSHSYPSATSNAFLNYKGTGIRISGDRSTIVDCFVINAGAENYVISGNNITHSFNKSYSNSNINPTDYYYLLKEARYNNASNIYVERVGSLEHYGHGIVLKDVATNNTINNSTVKNTALECSFSGVNNNTFNQCKVVGGSSKHGTILIANGAHHNTFKNCTVDNANGISFQDWKDGSGGPRDLNNAGNNNEFIGCTVKNSATGISFHYWDQLNGAANHNRFTNCSFINLNTLFVVDRPNNNNSMTNCLVEKVDQYQKTRYPNRYSLNFSIDNNTRFVNNGF